ncbi:hypothetical protein [Nitrobacter sp. Nb-311A]|uniref:hypothetical protein n=1 Tax=Nitrobacter sp. Nb-311A TaxID=314253 RepID=UPI001FD9C9D9|nr:hypothetical protein [Nitrobacter sp. Nb-311A]
MQGNPVSNSHLDGMNVVATTAQPIEMLERVEVINGLTGAFYGPASPAGMFNFIQKRPTDTFYDRFSGSHATSSALLAHGDFGGHVGEAKNVGYRINLLKVLIGVELGPVNYRPQFLVAVDITCAGVGSTPAPIVTPLRRSFLNFHQDVTAHPSSDVTPAPIHNRFSMPVTMQSRRPDKHGPCKKTRRR